MEHFELDQFEIRSDRMLTISQHMYAGITMPILLCAECQKRMLLVEAQVH